MGQDRQYSDEEIKETLRALRSYKEKWESVEKNNLERDVLRRIDNMVQDKNYRELGFENQDNNELEKEVEDAFASR